ncbi:ester cyclase [Rhizobium sp. NFACC06-2]|uniref:ester cyclase n=1 Tax=Rhizobium/Agrobacterium group TaxID=227290 RepID=UPI0008773D07|nr:ester cyclase [Rhizobium sp. NFACC06-2]SCY85172.1 Predicted ester cyclase [Rhizobium sp. NFACC06-2]SCY89548.1 Predicted ester cyclase [Rhizobium sp. NFACC06-2]
MTLSTDKAEVIDNMDIGRRTVIACLIGVTLPVHAVAAMQDDAAANKAVIRQLLEGVQRDGDFDLFERLFATAYVDHTPFGGFSPDRNGTRQIYRTFRAAFPDWNAQVHFQIAEGDLVSTYKTYHGTHLGIFMGIAATGRATRFNVMDVMRVRNGQITDHWTVADGAGLMAQIKQQD